MDESADQVRVMVLIRACRAAVGLSQTELANEIGVSQSTLARVEAGMGTLTASALFRAMRLFDGYGIGVEGIFRGSPSITFSPEFLEGLADDEEEPKEELPMPFVSASAPPPVFASSAEPPKPRRKRTR